MSWLTLSLASWRAHTFRTCISAVGVAIAICALCSLMAFNRGYQHGIRSELDPAEGVAVLKNRVVGFELHDLHAFNASGHDVPLGTGVGKLQNMLETIAKVKKGPVLMSIEYNSNPDNPSDDVKKCIEFLDGQALRLAKPAP